MLTTCMLGCSPSAPEVCRLDEGYDCSNLIIFPEEICFPRLSKGR